MDRRDHLFYPKIKHLADRIGLGRSYPFLSVRRFGVTRAWRVVAADIEAYERFFFEKLSRLPGVQEINSTVALSEIKSTTVLPV
jgi:hypothetical protein